jgi:hypothetical protein
MHVDGGMLRIKVDKNRLRMMCEGIVFGDFIRNGEVIDAR